MSGRAATTITDVKVAISIHFVQQGNVGNRKRMLRGIQAGEPRVGGPAHFGMNDRFERLAGVRVGEDDIRHPFAIKRAAGIKHVRAESLHDCGKSRRSRRNGFASNQIGIDRRDAKRLEPGTDVALTGGNTTGERYPPHSVVEGQDRLQATSYR